MSLFMISSCRKSDNANVPEFIEVPMPSVVKVSGDPTISAQDPSAFRAKFSVGLFFPDGDKPAKMDVVVRKNLDNNSTKVFAAGITTYPTELDISGADLTTLFPGAIVLGDKFDVGVDITLANGKKYLAFPKVGVPYGAGVASPAGSSTSTRFEAVCAFTAADYAGTFTVLADDWADFPIGSSVVVTVVSDSKLSFPSPVTGNPIIIDVNTATNVTSVAKQQWGDYGGSWQYGMVSAETITSPENFVAPCEGIISLQLKYTVAAGSFGDFIFKLQKQ